MTTISSTIGRNYRGELQAETDIDITDAGLPLATDPTPGSRAVLRLHTGKGSRGLATSATVGRLSADGRGFSFAMFSDYCARVAADPAARATEKNVAAHHAAALARVAQIIETARAHYAKRAA